MPFVEDGPNTLFVYGTLKRGQLNSRLLAPDTLSAEPASTRGRLYDLGLFPALVEGDGIVLGEFVRLRATAVGNVLSVLDRLEGYRPDDPAGSMYRRRVVEVTRDDGGSEPAHAYFYNRDPGGLRRIETGEWAGPSLDAGDTDAEHAAFKRHVREFSLKGRGERNEEHV